MPLNKLENFLKNVEGRILYVSPADLDSTDAITNEGNSLTKPFKTVQRALLQAARFSYIKGNDNDATEKTTILLMPGEHEIDNRPGFSIRNNGGVAVVEKPDETTFSLADLSLDVSTNFDLTQEDNDLYKFNSTEGGVIVPRGTSIVGLDLRKTKIRPKYVPNPTDIGVKSSAIFRVTGACYFWQFSIFDGLDSGEVYTDSKNFGAVNKSKPTFSHHKLTVFEYADGVNNVKLPVSGTDTGLTDLDMYYAKVSNAFNAASNRPIDENFPASTDGFAKQRPEWEIVGAFAENDIKISNIKAGDIPGVASSKVTVTTQSAHGLSVGTPINIKGVKPEDYNVSAIVASIDSNDDKKFTYVLPFFRQNLPTPATDVSGAVVTIETDTVSGASPYIFNVSLRSVFGMNGMHADGSKADGFRSMVVAQFTGVSLQKDDRAFTKYNKTSRQYDSIEISKVTGGQLAVESSATTNATKYHLDSGAIYREGWQSTHVKISNNAILQIVSVFAIGFAKHFQATSGGDASITNSNSNFGQLALVSDGFRKDAFQKDDTGFITHIISPQHIDTTEEKIEWVQLETGTDVKVSTASTVYLQGYDSFDVKPPGINQGFRIGARQGDKLYFETGGSTYSANIVMTDGAAGSLTVGPPTATTISSVKEYAATVQTPSDGNTFNFSSSHKLTTGEKIIINTTDGDFPENIEVDKVYYAIYVNDTTIRIAVSESDAINNIPLKWYAAAGTNNIKILSRVSDKKVGEIGHPIQWNKDTGNWYIAISNPLGNAGIVTAINNLTEPEIEPSYYKRITDSRSLDDKIYKLRTVIPKEVSGSKNPENGFTLQESSSTGVRVDGDYTKVDNLTTSDYAFQRNPRFISSCTTSSGIASITAEKPHNLKVNDLVRILDVRHSGNTTGDKNKGFNGDYLVTEVTDDLTFKYKPVSDPGSDATNVFAKSATGDPRITPSSDGQIPRFERKDLQSNIYIFRNETISFYDDGNDDGIYHFYPASANYKSPIEFSDEYSQNIVNLYPQLDRDNIDDNPKPSRSYANRFPVGNVTTNELKKSLTKESTDKFIKSIGLGNTVTTVPPVSSSECTITLGNNHNLSGITTLSVSSSGDFESVDIGTHYNVKIIPDSSDLNNWTGALATLVVSGSNVASITVTNPGSGFESGDTPTVDLTRFTGSPSVVLSNLTENELTGAKNLVVQFTGSGTKPDSYHIIKSIPSANQITIHASSVNIDTDQYAFIVGPAVSATVTGSGTEKTFTCDQAHGLAVGSKFEHKNGTSGQATASVGTFVVKTVTSSTIFTADVGTVSVSNGWVLKHGLSAHNATTGKGGENINVRGVQLFDREIAKVNTAITSTETSLIFTPLNSQTNVNKRFGYGDYIQIEDEILRIASKTATGSDNTYVVIRGALGTRSSAHAANSLITKIKPIPIEFHRPSILRASGHTFEYLGYGPGNYSTALPQVQVKTLTEREEFLSQSQESAAGAVVYTGMNDKGDFYIGNQKKSALTGEETTFDTPIPTVTGEDPSRLSVVFDEVTVKDRIVVEGGEGKNSLSQFDGPVTFSQNVRFKEDVTFTDQVKIKPGDTVKDSTSTANGALVVDGGVGVAGTMNIGGGIDVDGDIDVNGKTELDITNISETLNVVGISTFTGNIDANGDLDVDGHTELDNVNVSGISTFDGLIDADAGLDVTGHTELDNLNVSGISTSAGLNVTGNTTLSSLSVSGNANFASDTVQISNNKVKATTFEGTADNSNNVKVTGLGDTEGPHMITLIQGTLGGGVEAQKPMCVDSGLHYNSNTNTLTVTGDIIAYGADSLASDDRLKTNKSPITEALKKVNSINGFTYNWNDKAKDLLDLNSNKLQIGVSAQEVQKVLPEVVKSTQPINTDEEILVVSYEKLVPLLIEAIKQLSDKVDSLEERLNN
jgi:hypothetical protein